MSVTRRGPYSRGVRKKERYTLPTEFGLALRDLRVNHLNMTQDQMAVHLGVRQQEIANLETGRRIPTNETVLRKAIEIAQRVQMIQAARKMGQTLPPNDAT